jgi:phospholipid transport system substrate-binding protein
MISFARRHLPLLLLLAAGLAGHPAFAQTDTTSVIQAPINALDEGLMAVMKAGKPAPFTQRFQILAPVIDGAFDLSEILQRSVGPTWSEIAPDQQSKLLEVFRTFTIASYVANFDTDNGDTIQILPELRNIGDDRIVQTRLVPKSGTATEIDYQMHQDNAGWRAIDVLLDGSISRVAVQRSDFRAEIRTGDASRLIQSLQKKVSSLSGGTMS